MKPKAPLRSDTVRAAGKLTVEAITVLTDLVEEIHASYSPFSNGKIVDSKRRQTGISGFIYWVIRTITNFIGGGIEASLSRFQHSLGEHKDSENRETLISILNGVSGDYLAKENSSLAISFQFRKNGKLIMVDEIDRELTTKSGKLLILIHGLCTNDLQWTRNGHNHGELLAQKNGFTTIYTYYNSGLHISQNGAEFSSKMESLLSELPNANEIYFLCHSMGGLIARSACFYAMKSDLSWIKKLKKMVFLGTPHQGAPLERGGNWLESLLELHPYTYPFSKLGKIRSAGITDLRNGNLIDEEWNLFDRFELRKHVKKPVPLPDFVQCYTLASTISSKIQNAATDFVGDGLVPLDSAFGKHKNVDWSLNFAEENQALIKGIHHLDLLSDEQVFHVIKKWLVD